MPLLAPSALFQQETSKAHSCRERGSPRTFVHLKNPSTGSREPSFPSKELKCTSKARKGPMLDKNLISTFRDSEERHEKKKKKNRQKIKESTSTR